MTTVLTESQIRLARSPRDFRLFAEANRKRYLRELDAREALPACSVEHRRDERGVKFTAYVKPDGLVAQVVDGWA